MGHKAPHRGVQPAKARWRLLWIAAVVGALHWLVLAAIPWRVGGVLPATGVPVLSTFTPISPASFSATPAHAGAPSPRAKIRRAAPAPVLAAHRAVAVADTAAGAVAAAVDEPSVLIDAGAPLFALAVGEASDAVPEPNKASIKPPTVHLPAPMRLEFDVAGQAKGFYYSASAVLLWQHDGQHYQAHQEVRVLLLGTRTQTSVGDVSALGLLPQRFGDKSRTEQAAYFDYDQGRVTFSANTPPAAIAPGAQDRLSIFIQLGALLAAAPERYPVGTHIHITAVSARAADVWSFSVEGPETLELPVGTVQALKLERLPRQDSDQKAELWLAPSLGYLPARIRISQTNGDMVDLRLNASAAL